MWKNRYRGRAFNLTKLHKNAIVAKNHFHENSFKNDVIRLLKLQKSQQMRLSNLATSYYIVIGKTTKIRSFEFDSFRPTKKTVFDGLFLFCRSRRGREPTSRIFTMLALASLLIFVRTLPARELGSHSPRRARQARS